jgi:hypothetical protein
MSNHYVMAEQPGGERWYIKQPDNDEVWYEAHMLEGVWKVYRCWGSNTTQISSVQEIRSVQEFIANLTGKEIVTLNLEEQRRILMHEMEEEERREEEEYWEALW